MITCATHTSKLRARLLSFIDISHIKTTIGAGSSLVVTTAVEIQKLRLTSFLEKHLLRAQFLHFHTYTKTVDARLSLNSSSHVAYRWRVRPLESHNELYKRE